jgi:hypothetical protein
LGHDLNCANAGMAIASIITIAASNTLILVIDHSPLVA